MTFGAIIFYIFVIIAAVQLFYYLFFFRRLSFYKTRNKEHSQQHPVTIIICARDEYDNIINNLPGVLEQNYLTTHEVIVVNDNSIDDTKYILAELHKTFKKLQIVDLTQEAKMIAGKKFPLSIGIKEAKYEIVLLTDADCKPASENWLFKMQEVFADGVEIALGYGAYNKKSGFLNKAIRFETFHTALQYLSYALAGLPYMGVGRNLAYRKELFFKNKGFSSINNMPSGDDDLFINRVANKKNTAIVIEPEAFTYSEPKQTWKEWSKQKNRHYSTGRYYKASHKILLGLYSTSLVLFYPLLILSLIFFDWRIALIPFVIRMGIQCLIFKKAMDKLNEPDLFSMFWFWDIWMFIYYIIFAASIWKRPRKTWN
ncbi:MAG TPA: glycosyltransferase [Flavisolibacter sp.]|nr:glycosyltransferase [Flavisolibacter sp.]